MEFKKGIKFLRDHRVEGPPEETFTEGQVVTDRSYESQMHFVTRRQAAFIGDDGKLYDHEERLVEAAPEAGTKAPAGSRPAQERKTPRAISGGNVAKAPKAKRAGKKGADKAKAGATA
jgi:hypothetical protein